MSFRQRLVTLWGVGGVILILSQAVFRLSGPAIEPFRRGELTAFHWALYLLSLVVMGYSEGYRAFQKQFAPRSVARAFHLASRPSIPGIILAPPTCMGLLFATKKRLITSWSVLAGIIVLILAVRQLSYPWRGIVDGGVVLGLTWGILAVLVYYVKALKGQVPQVPHDFPEIE